MSRPNRYQIMELFKGEIYEALSKQGKAIFNFRDISRILELNRHKWRLPQSATTNELLNWLISKKILQELVINSIGIEKYIFKKDITIYEIATSLMKNSYLSHYSALFLHGLTNNIVKNIYVTQEQSKKSSDPNLELIQKNINQAFSKPMRRTNKIAAYQNYEIYLLNGKFTNKLGVIKHDDGVYVTNLERTLIDSVVRSEYSGGVFEVLNAFENAKGKASINKLTSFLTKMEFIYPYHQAIGFYLEQAGYKESVLKLLERFPMKYDFYLNYDIKNKQYSERWRLFYPEGL